MSGQKIIEGLQDALASDKLRSSLNAMHEETQGTGDPVVPAKTAGDKIGDAIAAGLQGRISDGTWVAPSSSLHPKPKKEADLNIERQAMIEELRMMQERALRLFDRMKSANFHSVNVLGGGQPIYGEREIALSKTKLREAFMWAQEAAYLAQRLSIPDD